MKSDHYAALGMFLALAAFFLMGAATALVVTPDGYPWAAAVSAVAALNLGIAANACARYAHKLDLQSDVSAHDLARAVGAAR